ncbi:hypothetical protein [Salmonella phage SP154]|nr:hypothetical protein [Salmonella phage SP154]
MNNELMTILDTIKSCLQLSDPDKDDIPKHSATQLCTAIPGIRWCTTTKGCFHCPIGYRDKKGYSYQIIQTWKIL